MVRTNGFRYPLPSQGGERNEYYFGSSFNDMPPKNLESFSSTQMQSFADLKKYVAKEKAENSGVKPFSTLCLLLNLQKAW